MTCAQFRAPTAQADSLRAKGECRGDTAAIRDPARGHDGYLASEIDDRGDQHQRCDPAGVAARLAALGD
jgi:hypothetical protein